MAKGKGGFIGQDGLNAPDAPTGVSGTAGDEQVDVSFTSPSDVGGSAITGYRVTDSTGAFGASGSASPITVTGLTNGTSYTFNVWAINAFGWSSPSDASGGVSPQAPRMLVFGGDNGSSTYNIIDYASMSTTGNFTDFGDISGITQAGTQSCSSSTRGVLTGIDNSGGTNRIDYVSIFSTGNTADFGDTVATGFRHGGSASSSTRGLFTGGVNTQNNIEYVTIASVGNATDFGDLTTDALYLEAMASPTRAVMGSRQTSGSLSNTMDYVTIASTGNATDFGDLNVTTAYNGACSNETRGLLAGGWNSGFTSYINNISYITIASTGNGTDFGDLTQQATNTTGSASATRAIFALGSINSNTESNVVEYATIASLGNATDFGDLTVGRYNSSSCSSAHGGLS